MVHTTNPQNTEVDAYSYIKDQLLELGWVVKNPARFDNGEVYKQNEVLANKEIKKYWNLDRPEATVKISENRFWVIESKRDTHQLNQALNEAKDQYAKKINKSNSINCVLISGVAGNDSDGYLVSNLYLKEGKWEKIIVNGEEKTSLLSKREIEHIIDQDTPIFNDYPEISEQRFLKVAEEINDNLHIASINKSERAKFIAGIILTYAKQKPDLDKETTLLTKEINDIIESVLYDKGKAHFIDYIKLNAPPSRENHVKYKQAIIQTYRELDSLDIASAMKSGHDVLGKFYEVFLKYGNGAKEIGIVLTPRHITKFAVEALDIKYNDYVYDPTCGTGGFLVAAFDYVKKNSNENQIDTFKEFNIFGIEQDDGVVALALVNMIFRGDGRHNIKDGNCLNYDIEKTLKNNNITGKYVGSGSKGSDDPIITRVLMNPPFSLKNKKEKEYHFVDHALNQMQDGGILFAVLPLAIMAKNTTINWRKNLLKNNTLLSVISFPSELFYPSAAAGTIGVFIKKGVPHDINNQKTLFIRAFEDGFRIKKNKRIKDKKARNILSEVKNEVKSFLNDQTIEIENVPELKKSSLIDINDPLFELVAEYYLDTYPPNIEKIEEGINDLIKNCASYILKR